MLLFTKSVRASNEQEIARQDSQEFYRKLSVAIGIICAAIEIVLVIAMATNAHTDTVTPDGLEALGTGVTLAGLIIFIDFVMIAISKLFTDW